MSPCLLPEDIGENLKTVSQSLDSNDISKSLDIPIRVKYNMIDMDITGYNFSDLDTDESSKYFKLMRNISNMTINNLIDSKNSHQWHFHKSKTHSKTNLRKEIDRIAADDDKWDKDNLPIYHIVLDPECNNIADRTKDVRNQRIYFLLGAQGEIHILFFDRYHELNPAMPLSNAPEQNKVHAQLLKSLKKELK